ncbi:MAG: DUF2288 domain-containing protein [Spirochaetota bacterium]
MHRQTIRAGIASIDWEELKYFFARGQVIWIDPSMDLEETAYQICMNNTESVDEWMQEGKVQRMSDERAKHWYNQKLRVTSVVIQPWVLVQEPPDKTNDLAVKS